MSDLDEDLCLFFLVESNPLLKLSLFRAKSKKRKWVNDNNIDRSQNEFNKTCKSLKEHPGVFREYYGMDIKTFNYVLESIKEDIQTYSNFRECVSPEEKLSITLRYLSTGMSFAALGRDFRLNNFTIGKIVESVIEAIWKRLSHRHMAVPSHAEFLKIAAEFKDGWNIPNVCGCIDGKHIRIKCPKRSGTIVLQAVADAKCRFQFIDVGEYGTKSDGERLNVLTLYQFLDSFKENLPKPSNFEGSVTEMPFVVLGGDAYPLKPYLMKPYTHKGLSHEERLFNNRISRARRCVECAFGILSAKWRLLENAITTRVEKAEKIVKSMCLLHNIIIDLEGAFSKSVCQESLEYYKRQPSVSFGSGRNFNRSSMEALSIRNAFKDSFISSGAVPTQNTIDI